MGGQMSSPILVHRRPLGHFFIVSNFVRKLGIEQSVKNLTNAKR